MVDLDPGQRARDFDKRRIVVRTWTVISARAIGGLNARDCIIVEQQQPVATCQSQLDRVPIRIKCAHRNNAVPVNVIDPERQVLDRVRKIQRVGRVTALTIGDRDQRAARIDRLVARLKRIDILTI